VRFVLSLSGRQRKYQRKRSAYDPLTLSRHIVGFPIFCLFLLVFCLFFSHQMVSLISTPFTKVKSRQPVMKMYRMMRSVFMERAEDCYP